MNKRVDLYDCWQCSGSNNWHILCAVKLTDSDTRFEYVYGSTHSNVSRNVLVDSDIWEFIG